MMTFIKNNILLLLLSLTVLGQQQNIRLRTIGPEHGLPSIRVNTVYQDNYQYMWIGTEVGLKRYDGYQMQSINTAEKAVSPLNNEPIRSLLQDKKNRLWIATVNLGVGYLDLSDYRFTEIGPILDGAQLEVRDLALDQDQILWVATWRGLFKVDTKKDSLVIEKADNKELSIRCLHVDERGQLWVGTESKGLFTWSARDASLQRFNPLIFPDGRRIYSLLQIDDETFMAALIEKIVIFKPNSDKAEELDIRGEFESGEITSLVKDRTGGIWAGSSNVGLIHFPSGKWSPVFYSGINEYGESLRSSGILDLVLDHHGTMWVATRGAGLQLFDPETPFHLYTKDDGSETGISDPSIRAIVKDDENLWVGSYGGLDCFSLETGQRKHFDHLSQNRYLPNKNVYALVSDEENDLWIGTEGGGLFRLPQGSEQIHQIDFGTDSHDEARQIYELLVTKDSLLLIGTGNGLYQLNMREREWPQVKRIPLELERTNVLDGEDIFALLQSRDGSIWVGTRAVGLYKLDEKYAIQNGYFYRKDDLNSLSSNQIKCIHEDQAGLIWVGTQGGGLNRLNPGDGSFFRITEQQGLADNTVYGILEDGSGRLWMSTNLGISVYDPESGVIENYGLEYGLQSNEFNTGAFYRSKDGDMYFGGIGGLNRFHPMEVQDKTSQLKVTITDFLVKNRSVNPGNDLLPENISMLKEITISHKETLITLEFSAMDFIDPEGTEYRYRLHDVTQGWIAEESSHRMATFTNPPSGSHLFEIQARRSQNHDFGPVKQLLIRVKPAPWKSPWALTLYLLVFLGILLNLRQNEIKKINLQTELNRNRQEAQKLSEIDEMKSRLISNVSHELRTPLTLLGGQIEQLSQTAGSKLTPQARKSLQSAKRSLVRITALSDQLFELARFAAGKIHLKASRHDLVETLSNILEDFKGQVGSKDHKLIFNCEVETLPIYLEQAKFEQILFNLLSNAIKFSHKGSEVSVDLFDDRREKERGVGNFAIIRVRNRGRGIPASALTNIFDRLYQIDSTDSDEKGGAGIGLALVKELVELHGGSISVSSEPEGETIFEFTLPKGLDHLSQGEIADIPQKETPVAVIEDEITLDDYRQSKILVVEDDLELRDFISQGLSTNYKVITADDGAKGYQIAQKELPDMVVSDVNMPNKNGLQLLREIRNDAVLSHVPVILLTGQTSAQDRFKGYEALANDYIGKPFKMEELKIRIESLFRSRQQLTDKLKNEGLQGLVLGSNLTRNDDRLLLKLKELIEANLDNSDLTVEHLAKSVFMSKRQMERKIKDITGQPPAELIRQIRLATARKYLMEGVFATVAEISHAVGFKNVKYFSRLFRNQYGQSPSEILKD